MENLLFNPVKERLLNKERLSAAWISMGSPVAAEIMAQAGFDILVVDGEHSPAAPNSMVGLLHAMNGYPCVPFVRAPWNDLVAVKRLLDCGFLGIHIPFVNTAEEAEAAVRACKYPPLGNRGIAGSHRAAGYGSNFGQYLQRANDQIVVMIALETMESINNLDSILEVEGVDGIFIGPMDLSTNMGYFASPTHPEVKRVMMAAEAKVNKTDKFLGTIAGTMTAAKELYERGYSYVVFGGDIACMKKGASQMLGEFQEMKTK
jgi:2-dehydro-3-deoxyglucarate aldolase/4-hydroxy-2-oxoheptanedioate aldolase